MKNGMLPRYDHSVGVMLLIRMLGGTLEEQIAGLLHDVSHTAFSHVADYVFENRDEDYHEIIFRSVVESSEYLLFLKSIGSITETSCWMTPSGSCSSSRHRISVQIEWIIR